MMSPLPYDQPSSTAPTATFTCPRCTAVVERSRRTLVCGECGHVPKHGSD